MSTFDGGTSASSTAQPRAKADPTVPAAYTTEPVDEVWLEQMPPEFKVKRFQLEGRGEVDLDGKADDEASEAGSKDKDAKGEAYEALLAAIGAALEDDVKEVRLSGRLTDSPSCLVLEEGDLSPQMEAMLRQAGQAVPERKPILRLLTEMQRAFCHVALVKDEFGVTKGLVTQEDILEEIVGEIRDEFDSEELLTIRKLRDGSYEVLGRVSVLDFNRESGWQVPAEKGDTIGGLCFNTLERAPRKGEKITVPGYVIECIDVSGSRITRVKVTEEPVANGLAD